MSQKLGALFHEEVTALCTLTSEFHYLFNASIASYVNYIRFQCWRTRDVEINVSLVETESSRLIVFLTALF